MQASLRLVEARSQTLQVGAQGGRERMFLRMQVALHHAQHAAQIVRTDARSGDIEPAPKSLQLLAVRGGHAEDEFVNTLGAPSDGLLHAR